MAWLTPVTLCGSRVRLELLDQKHHDDLVEATHDGKLWELWYTTVPAPEGMAAEIDRRLDLFEHKSMLPFAAIDLATGMAVGMTTFMHVEEKHRRLEIGSTWYRRSMQRTGFNTECKLLLLTHAFESMDCIAVELRTHFMNRQSRRAIEGLGAKLDGVLRSHQVTRNGSLRDTCVYSIVASEWAAVKKNLEFRLGQI